MNRRDFLRPRHLARSAGQAAAILRDTEAPPSPREFSLLQFSRQAMATTFEVLLPLSTPDALALADQALNDIDRLEDQLTVYRETSEVSRLNRDAADAPVKVEDRLHQLLVTASVLTAETEGAFDVTTGPLIKAWGFYRRAGRVPSPEERTEVLQRVGMRHVVLDEERRTIQFSRRGTEINLGSIGKGYALDRAAERLREDGRLSAGLLHGGHSSVYAIGSSPIDERGWEVGIAHPWQPGRRLAVVRVRDGGLATSAATFQHLEHEGRKLGHILDPRTGWPAEGMASVTVTAPTAAAADALATAFFILGTEPARAYCTAHPEVGVLLLPERGRPLALNLDCELT